MSRLHRQLPASCDQYHGRRNGLPILGRDLPVARSTRGRLLTIANESLLSTPAGIHGAWKRSLASRRPFDICRRIRDRTVRPEELLHRTREPAQRKYLEVGVALQEVADSFRFAGPGRKRQRRRERLWQGLPGGQTMAS